jgi:1,4-dihydroxy-2-naphthoate octaprenyltransferase
MSESSFITLKKTDVEFKKYLRGDVSSDWLPIPVESINLQQSNESVTFRKLPVSEVSRPFFWFFTLIRIELIILTLAPAFCVGLYLHTLKFSFSNIDFGLSLLSLLFLHMSIYCMNDYLDHMGGVDRVNDKGGSHVIQKGWIRARSVFILGGAFMAGAIAFATPLFLQNKVIFYLALFVFGILGMGYFLARWKVQAPTITLFILFLLFGPALTLSTEWLLVQNTSVNSLLLGTYFGLMTVTYVHGKQILCMATDQMAGIKSLAVQLGIDKSVKVLRVLCVLSVLIYATAFYQLSMNLSYVLVLALLPSLIFVIRQIRQIQSPFSSHLHNTYRRVLRMYGESVILLILSWVLF